MKGEAGWPARLEVSEHWDFNIQLFLKKKKNIGLNLGLCAWNFLPKLPPQFLVSHFLRAYSGGLRPNICSNHCHGTYQD